MDKDAAYFRNVVAGIAASNGSALATTIVESTRFSQSVYADINQRQEVLAATPRWRQGLGGIFEPGFAIPFDRNRVINIPAKIARAMYYRGIGACLPPEALIDVRFAQELRIDEEYGNQLGSLLGAWQSFGDKIFQWRAGYGKTWPGYSIWLFRFYDQQEFLVYTMMPEAMLTSDNTGKELPSS